MEQQLDFQHLPFKLSAAHLSAVEEGDSAIPITMHHFSGREQTEQQSLRPVIKNRHNMELSCRPAPDLQLSVQRDSA